MRLLLRYLLMVVLMVLTIVAALHLGQGLDAPASVHGEWRLSSEAPGCPALSNQPDPAAMSILQSGRHLEIRMGGSDSLRVRALMQGTHIAAQARTALSLSLDRRAEPHTLSGEMTLPGCPPLAVTYVRIGKKSRTVEGPH